MEAIITLTDVEDALCVAIKKAIAENAEGDDISSAIEDNYYDIDPSGDRWALTDFIHEYLEENGEVTYTDLEKGYQNIEGELLVRQLTEKKFILSISSQILHTMMEDGLTIGMDMVIIFLTV